MLPLFRQCFGLFMVHACLPIHPFICLSSVFLSFLSLSPSLFLPPSFALLLPFFIAFFLGSLPPYFLSSLPPYFWSSLLPYFPSSLLSYFFPSLLPYFLSSLLSYFLSSLLSYFLPPSLHQLLFSFYFPLTLSFFLLSYLRFFCHSLILLMFNIHLNLCLVIFMTLQMYLIYRLHRRHYHFIKSTSTSVILYQRWTSLLFLTLQQVRVIRRATWKRRFYMPAWVYEFYLHVPMVTPTIECSKQVRDTIKMKRQIFVSPSGQPF